MVVMLRSVNFLLNVVKTIMQGLVWPHYGLCVCLLPSPIYFFIIATKNPCLIYYYTVKTVAKWNQAKSNSRYVVLLALLLHAIPCCPRSHFFFRPLKLVFTWFYCDKTSVLCEGPIIFGDQVSVLEEERQKVKTKIKNDICCCYILII